VRYRIQVVGWTLIWSGVFIFGYVGWQLFGTDLITARVQAVAEVDLEQTFQEQRESLPPVEEIIRQDGGNVKPVVVRLQPEDYPPEDTGFGAIRIPKLGLDVVVFEGVTPAALKKGPGHIPGTVLPGQPGNAAISGHRTTYGRPFYDLDLLEPGDMIEVETAIGVHIYEVRESFIVFPTDVWVIDQRDGAWLTLTTCNPKFSARERLIISAELVDGPNLDYVAYASSL
jgi:sortase A